MTNKTNAILRNCKHFKKWFASLMILLSLPACAEQNSFSNYEENFTKWNFETEKLIVSCGKDQKCIRGEINKSIGNIPTTNDNLKLSELVRETRAGLALIKISSDVFYDDFGIDEKSFTGVGLSVPTKSYNDAERGVLEYWTPNLNQNEPTLWTWKIPISSPTEIGKSVGEVIATTASLTDYNNDKIRFSECLAGTKPSNVCNFKKSFRDKEKPILFRCAQFDEKKYTKSVGRNTAKRVFFTRLSDVFDLSINDACSQTDRKIKHEDNTQSIFLWVFIPTSSEQVVPATWGNLFRNFEKWEKN